jgi:hypothetical protein
LEVGAQKALREKQRLILVSLYLEKAYDTCWRHHIVRTLHKWRFRGQLLYFVKSFTEDRTFKVIIGDMKSKKMTIGNGVVQAEVQNVKLFLIEISEMANKTKNHTTKDLDQEEIKPYSADAWTKK